MIRHRLVALAALVFTLLIAVAPAEARDPSPCASNEPKALKSGTAAAEACPDAALQKAKIPAGQPVLQENGAAATQGVATLNPPPIIRAQHFVYRILRPEAPSGETIILMHGSGGDEASLFKLASRVAPHAVLLGIRGRIVQKGRNRWYARLTPTTFDQADIRKEAKAFVLFLKERMAADKLDLDHTVFIGYSNGANLIAAVTLLYPDLIRRAVLLRAMPVLDTAPEANLKGRHFLVVPGKIDQMYGPFAPALEALLRDHGASVDARMVAGDHYLGDEDVKVVSDWLKASNAVAGGTAQ